MKDLFEVPKDSSIELEAILSIIRFKLKNSGLVRGVFSEIRDNCICFIILDPTSKDKEGKFYVSLTQALDHVNTIFVNYYSPLFNSDKQLHAIQTVKYDVHFNFDDMKFGIVDHISKTKPILKVVKN